MYAAIIGCGYAGLITAISCKREGIPIRIFEALEEPSDIGGSITMFPNSMKILRVIGVADDIIEAGVVITRAKFKDSIGNYLVTRSMGTATLYGEPTVTIRRALLHRLLRQKAESMEITIEYGKRVSSIDQDSTGVKIKFTKF